MSKQTFFPYRAYPGALKLQVVPRDRYIQGGATNRVTAYGTDGAELVLDVTTTLADDLYARVLPAHEQQQPPLEIRLVLQGVEARQRQSVRLTEDAGRRGVITLRKRDWYGTMQMQAFLIRTTADPGVPAGYAGDRGAVLASSDTVEVLFDEPTTPPTGGLLNIQWLDFSQSPEPWIKRQAENLFALDITGDPPTLYLNRAVQGAQTTLGSGATHGRKARIRDLSFSLVYHQVWTSLLGAALTDLTATVQEAGDEVAALAELGMWQKRAIQDWVPDLYPEHSADDALSALLRDMKGANWALELLVRRLPEALQRRQKTAGKFMQAATEEWNS